MRMGSNDINRYLRIKKKKTYKTVVSITFLFELPSMSHDYVMYLKQNMDK